MAEHTPGPWTTRPNPDAPEWWIDGPVGLTPNVSYETIGPPIGMTYTKENARLIAAAPDLLVALDNFIADYDTICTEYSTANVARVVDMALPSFRAAIAKATNQ